MAHSLPSVYPPLFSMNHKSFIGLIFLFQKLVEYTVICIYNLLRKRGTPMYIDDLRLSDLLDTEDFELTERELLALNREIPMTQGLFNGCISKCDFDTANELFFKYPDFAREYARIKESELNAT